MASEAHLRANSKYEKANITKVSIRLNKRTEPDLIEWMDAFDNKQGYIKDLIRKDMEAFKKASAKEQ